MLAFFVAAATPIARAEDAPVSQTATLTAEGSPEDFEKPPTPAERLNLALSQYQQGQGTTAQHELAKLVNDPSVTDEQLRQRARVYLGEVLYLHQNEEEARRVFEVVLTLDPGYTIDPFAHPPDVCGFFETVRAYIVTPAAQSLAASAPPPTSAFMGFGVYHFQTNQGRKGTRIALAQTTAGLVSLVGFAGLLDDRRYLNEDDKLSSLQLRRGIQWGSTAAFYAVWAWAIADANQHWRANVSLQPMNSIKPDENGFGLPSGLHIGLTVPAR